jgi:hypothetical protein
MDLLIDCSSHDLGEAVIDIKFHVIFYATIEKLIATRKSDHPELEYKVLQKYEADFGVYAKEVTSVGQYKAKCDDLKDFFNTLVRKMYELAANRTNKKQSSDLPDPVDSLMSSGVITDFKDSSRITKLWTSFTQSYASFVSSPSKDNETALRINASMVGMLISIEITTRKGMHSCEMIDFNIEMPISSELHQESPFVITWAIDSTENIEANPNVVSINWNYVNGMLSRVLGAINSYDKSPQARAAIKSFLDWYDIMRGSNASILSPQIRDWIIIGRQHVRNIVVILSRMPSQVTNYGQATRDFLGCRSALGTWYIGIIDSLLMVERNPTNRTYLQSFVNDMKRYCK